MPSLTDSLPTMTSAVPHRSQQDCLRFEGRQLLNQLLLEPHVAVRFSCRGCTAELSAIYGHAGMSREQAVNACFWDLFQIPSSDVQVPSSLPITCPQNPSLRHWSPGS